MSSYLNAAQVTQLLKPINPKRVTTRDGMAHLEAYDVRAHLDRVFGFARWSADVIDVTPLFETVGRKNDKDDRQVVSVGYRATVRLAVCAPDGTLLATYSECATGDAINFPINKRADAHDFAIKTAESQALKRCATNLGDQFGLSLYRKGSTTALVGRTLDAVTEDGDGADVQPDEHMPAESTDRGLPAREGIETNNAHPTPAVPPPVVPVRNGEDVPLPDPTPDGEVLLDEQAELDKVAQRLADRARQAGGGRGALAEIARLKVQAGSQGLVGRLVTVRDEQHPLGQVLDEAMKAATGGAR